MWWSNVRRGSPTFKRWISVELSEENFRQIYVPIGFAHGFCVRSDFAEVEYKCSDVYQAATSSVFAGTIPRSAAFAWPIAEPILSDKDRTARRWRSCCHGCRSTCRRL